MLPSHFTVRPTRAGRVVGVGLGRSAYVGGAVALLLAAHVHAGPEGANVKAGQASFSKAGNTTVIHASDNAIIDYTRFGIGAGETVRFVQPGATARVLNRVIGGEASKINGTLTANGIVYIANPAGIFFGDQAIVNVGGLVAAGANITDADFLNNIDQFTGVSGEIANLGTITAGEGGAIHFVGSQIGNHGTIVAEQGLVTMSSGDDVYLGTRDGHTFVQIKNQPGPAQAGAAIENTGTVRASGGAAMMVAGDMFSIAATHSGHTEATDIAIEGRSGDGTVLVSGTLDATSDTGRGGAVRLLADRVGVRGDARIDVSGATGGGSVRIGGDLQGQGTLQTATRTFVGSGTSISADALVSGDAGDVIVWADDTTQFGGTITARSKTGRGGFAEVSGKQTLQFVGDVDLSGATGNGALLLDPDNITVDDFGGMGDALTDVDMFDDLMGTDSDLDVSVVNNATANVILQATDTIRFNSAVDMVNDNVGITADAGNNIIVDAAITTRGGDVTLTSDSQLMGSMASGSGSISVNAPIRTDGGGLTGGAITLNATGASGTGTIDLGADLITDGGAITIVNDVVNLTANTTLNSDATGASMTPGDIAFQDAGTPTIDGAFDLTIDAGATGTATLGAIGQTTAPTALSVRAGTAELSGNLAVDAPVDLATDVGAITLLANSTIDVTGSTDASVSLAGATGDFDLGVTGDAGSAITLGTTVANSLAVTGDGLTLNGAILVDQPLDFTNVNGITLAGPVSIIAGSGGASADITFDSANTIVGAFPLTITGGTVTLFGVGDGMNDPTTVTIAADGVMLNSTIAASEGVTVGPNSGDVGLNDAAGAFQVSLADLALFDAPSVIIGGGGAETINVAGLGPVDLSALNYDLTLQGLGVMFNTSANDGVVMGMDRVLRLTATSIDRADSASTLDVQTSGTGGLVFISARTVGGTNRLQSDVGAMAGVVSGGVFIDNVSPLEIGTVGGVVGLTTDTEIDVSADGPIDVTSFVGGIDNSIITLTSTGGDAADITVSGEIRGEAGPVTLNAENDIAISATGLVRTTEGGAISLNADTDTGGAGGGIAMTDGGVIRSDAGSIQLDATGDIALALIEITDDGDALVAVRSSSGSVTDANADSTNIAMPGGGSGNVTFSAGNGAAGDGDAIELAVNGADAFATTDGNTMLAFDGDGAGGFTATNGDIDITSTGTVATAGAWDGGTIRIESEDLDLTETIAGRDAIVINRTTSGPVAIGNEATGSMAGETRLSRTEMDLLSTPDATIGGANASSITVSGLNTSETDLIDALTLVTPGAVSIEGQPSAFQQLSVLADDGVSISVPLAAAGDLLIDADANNASDSDDMLQLVDNASIDGEGAITLAATTGGILVDAADPGPARVIATGDLIVEDALDVRSALALTSAGSATLMAPATVTDVLLSVQGDTGVTVGQITTDASVVLESSFDTGGSGVTTLTDAVVGNGADASIEIRGADIDIQSTVSATEGQVRIFRADDGDLTVGNGGIVDNTELSRISTERLTLSAINPMDNAVIVDGLDAASLAGVTGDILVTAVQQGGQVRFEGGASSAPNLDVRADDGVTFDADVTTTVGDLLVSGDDDNAADGDDAIRIGDAALASAGVLRLEAPSGGVILTGADGSSVTLEAQTVEVGALTATNSTDLTINTGAGIDFDALDINDGALAIAIDTDDDEAATGSLGDVTAGSVQITGGVDDTIDLGTLDVGSGGLSLTGGDIMLSGDAMIAGGGATVSNAGTFTLADSVTVDVVGGFTQAGAGRVGLGGTIRTDGTDLLISSPIDLTNDATLDTGTGAGNIALSGGVDGPSALTATAGDGTVAFGEPVGMTTELSALTAEGRTITFTGPITAFGDISLDVDDNFTLTDSFTTTGNGDLVITHAADLRIPVATDLDLAGGFVANGPGTAILEGNFGRTGQSATFLAPVIFEADTVLTGNDFFFNSTVNPTGDFSLETRSTDFSIFLDEVGGVTPLRSFRSSIQGDTAMAGGVTAGSIRIRNPLLLSGDTTLTATDPSTGFVALTGVNAASGTPDLTVNVPRVGASTDSPTVLIAGNMGELGALGDITINTDGARAGVPAIATIETNGDTTIITDGDVTIGASEKFTSVGALTIRAGGTVTLGDVVAIGNLVVDAPAIVLQTRPGGDVINNQGLVDTDLGADIVVGGDVDFRVTPSVTGTDRDPVFATPDGGGDVRGTLAGFIFQSFGSIEQGLVTLATPGADGALPSIAVLDLISTGPTTANVAEALAGALPRETRDGDIAQDGVTEAQARALEELGILPNDLSTDQLIEFLVGRAIYDDFPRSTGLGATESRVTMNRLSRARVREALETYDLVFRQEARNADGAPFVDENGRIVRVSRADAIQQMFESSVDRFMGGRDRFDADAYRRAVATDETQREALDLIEEMTLLFDSIDGLGLSRAEAQSAREFLLQRVRPSNLNINQFTDAVVGN